MNIEKAEVYFNRNGFIFVVDRWQNALSKDDSGNVEIMGLTVTKWDNFNFAKEFVMKNVNNRYFCNLTEAKRLGFV